MRLFTKKERSTFPYWFAHWCAFQMVALCLGIWKPKYLLHDIKKPFMMRRLKDYKKVQLKHRAHANHHVEYLIFHDVDEFDIDSFIIDNECSRFTKKSSPLTCRQYLDKEIAELIKNIGDVRALLLSKTPDEVGAAAYAEAEVYHEYLTKVDYVYNEARKRLDELGL